MVGSNAWIKAVTFMSKPGSLLFCDEAARFIESIQNPVTKSLVNMAFVHLVKKAHFDHALPRTDLDMAYLVQVLQEYLGEHDVIARTLQGERVGAWFENELQSPR